MANRIDRDFTGYGRNPPDPKWPNGARLALNIVVNIEEGAEPSVLDGHPSSESGLTEGGASALPGRDLAAESMFEFGTRAGYWRIVRLLEERNLPATAMACGLALERNPAIVAHLRDLNFDVCAHGWRWEHHRGLTVEQERDQISRTIATFQNKLGSPPPGWYCRYGPSVNTRSLLLEHDCFIYDSDAYNDELPYWIDHDGRRHLIVPYGLVNNDAKFHRGGLSTGRDFSEALIESFDMLYREGATAPKMMSVGLHLRISGHPGRASGLERFLDHVIRHEDVWICQRVEIARHWHDNHTLPPTPRKEIS